ncbi:thioesterase family protein [Rhodococcus sp. MTM3W5.2]|uniref:thioesterase family protein n=1 Tax=Rhodococcus sp. MTM3W5.2 TaxID=1805827 RepID=UPI00167A8872|nr:thioesterase family protein [Rhodococcus sp. MTM3W5.2]
MLNQSTHIVVYRAHAAFTDALGLGDEYVRETRFGKVAVQTAMTYEREVRRGARLAVDSWLLGVDAKRLHFFHEVHNLGDQTRVAVSEQLDLHVDLETRRTTPMPRTSSPASHVSLLTSVRLADPKVWGARFAFRGVDRRT